eukprot:5395913-Pleurochrysis_carterae.AAC.1
MPCGVSMLTSTLIFLILKPVGFAAEAVFSAEAVFLVVLDWRIGLGSLLAVEARLPQLWFPLVFLSF